LELLPVFFRVEAREPWANLTDHHPNAIAHAVAAEEITAFVNREFDAFSEVVAN
jgi:hypothetical protein